MMDSSRSNISEINENSDECACGKKAKTWHSNIGWCCKGCYRFEDELESLSVRKEDKIGLIWTTIGVIIVSPFAAMILMMGYLILTQA